VKPESLLRAGGLSTSGRIEPPLLRRSIQHAEGACYGETKPRSLLDTFTFIHEHKIRFDFQRKENGVAFANIEVWQCLWVRLPGRRHNFEPVRWLRDPLSHGLGRSRADSVPQRRTPEPERVHRVWAAILTSPIRTK
jgi:hypothetical protein